MKIKHLRHPRASLPAQVYLLDLDNTLHMASHQVLPEINRQMTIYISNQLGLDAVQASQLRTHYWQRYGATLLGLIKHHAVNPHEFLAQTHQLGSFKTQTHRHASVVHRLKHLNGIRILLTNAPRAYAVDVCKTLGFYRHLHAIVGIEDMVIHGQWRPKPSAWLWAGLRRQLRVSRCLLADDTHEHLRQAARHGIQTVWVTPSGLGFGSGTPKGATRHRIRQFEALRTVKRTPGRRGPGVSACA